MIQPKIASVGGSDLAKMARNLLDRPGKVEKRYALTSKSRVGTGPSRPLSAIIRSSKSIPEAFKALSAFIAGSSTLI
jgi:hypothetical protein